MPAEGDRLTAAQISVLRAWIDQGAAWDSVDDYHLVLTEVAVPPGKGNPIDRLLKVYLDKRCPEHGRERVLVADDVEYYKRCREVFIKPPEQPQHNQTPIRYGCPYDCGLCPDHEQHSCLALIEVTDACNLRCPVCYAESGPHRPDFRPL